MPIFGGDKKVYVISAVIVLFVVVYFLINYQVKETLHRELRKLSDRKKKKERSLLMKQRKMMQMRDENRNDMDSYQDPAEGYNENNDNNEHYDNQRLSKDDMLMRDFA